MGPRNLFFKHTTGNSLAVQWLGLSALTAGAGVQSLVRELRSHKPHGTAPKTKIKSKKPKHTTQVLFR